MGDSAFGSGGPSMSSPDFSSSDNSFVARRNSLIAFPTVRAISGNRLGPNNSKPATAISRISPAPRFKVAGLSLDSRFAASRNAGFESGVLHHLALGSSPKTVRGRPSSKVLRRTLHARRLRRAGLQPAPKSLVNLRADVAPKEGWKNLRSCARSCGRGIRDRSHQ